MTDRDLGFQLLRQGTLYQRWARDNPRARKTLDTWFAGGPPPDTTPGPGKATTVALGLFAQALDGLDALAQGSLWERWTRDNPGEARALIAFRAAPAGTAAPKLQTPTGRALVVFARMVKPQSALWRRGIVYSAGLSAFHGGLRQAARAQGFSVVMPNLLHDPSAGPSERELVKLTPELRANGWKLAGWGTYGQGTDPVKDARAAATIVERVGLDGWTANGELWAETVTGGFWKTDAFLDEWDRLLGRDVPLAISCLSSDTATYPRLFDWQAVLQRPGVSIQPQVYGNVDRGYTVAAALGMLARAGVPRERVNLTLGTYHSHGLPIPWADYRTWAGARSIYLGERITAAEYGELARAA